MNQAMQARLRFIDFLLAHYGTLNRSAIVDYYGLSQPQASMDIKAYQEHAPGNMRFDQTQKCYCRAPGYVRVWP